MSSNQNAAGWPTKQLVDCTSDGNISYGIVQPGQHTESGIPIIRVNNFKNGVLDDSDVLRVSNSIEENYRRTRLQGGEVLLTLVGSVGQTAIVPDDLAGWNVARAIAVIRPSAEVSAKWLAICLQSADARHFLDGRANTTVQKTLNLGDVKRVPIPIPPKEVRCRIESMITSIDAKIDLNRRINQTLEAMAQAIFKSWFVDFDPVKARIAAIAEGRDPLRAAMSAISGKPDAELDALPLEQYDQLAATAALFPDEMEESELGEIPRGWAPAALSTVCGLNTSSWSAKTLPASVKYVDLANTKNGEVIEVQTMEGSNIPSRARRVLAVGDTIVGTVRPGNRSFALVGEAGLTGSTGFAVLRPKKSYLREYVYLAATSDANIDRLAHLADGGAYPAVRPELVVSDALPIPQDDLLREFHRILSHMFDQILAKRREILDLADLRDTLLPKLLSGELSVADSAIA